MWKHSINYYTACWFWWKCDKAAMKTYLKKLCLLISHRHLSHNSTLFWSLSTVETFTVKDSLERFWNSKSFYKQACEGYIIGKRTFWYKIHKTFTLFYSNNKTTSQVCKVKRSSYSSNWYILDSFHQLSLSVFHGLQRLPLLPCFSSQLGSWLLRNQRDTGYWDRAVQAGRNKEKKSISAVFFLVRVDSKHSSQSPDQLLLLSPSYHQEIKCFPF